VDVETARAIIAAEPPRRLRLDELLRELGAADRDQAPPTRAAATTVGALVDKAAESGFGFLVGVLTLIAIPFVGLSTPFGLAIRADRVPADAGPPAAVAAGARPPPRAVDGDASNRVLGILTRRPAG